MLLVFRYMLFHEPLEMRKWCQLPYDITPSCQLMVRDVLISKMLKCGFWGDEHLRISELYYRDKIHFFVNYSLYNLQQNLHNLLTLERSKVTQARWERWPFSQAGEVEWIHGLFWLSWWNPPSTQCVCLQPGWLTELLIFILIRFSLVTKKRIQLYNALRTWPHFLWSLATVQDLDFNLPRGPWLMLFFSTLDINLPESAEASPMGNQRVWTFQNCTLQKQGLKM